MVKKLRAVERKKKKLSESGDINDMATNPTINSSDPDATAQQCQVPDRLSEATASEPSDRELIERATMLTDPNLLWSHFFSGVIDSAAAAVDENLDESGLKFTSSQERESARERGEHRFSTVCHFPIKLILTPLKRGRGVANTFASLLSMQFGPLHAALQVGDVILEWDDSSLVHPYQSDYEDRIIELEVQRHSRWVHYTKQHQPEIKRAVDHLDFPEQIELIYTVTSEKKNCIDDLIQVIIRYNKYFSYSLLHRNCQHFVSDALRALKVDLPEEFTGGLGDYYDSLVQGKTPSVPSNFKNHSLLDTYVVQKQRDGVLASMPQHDLEYLLALYFRFHLESKTRFRKDCKPLEEWRCEEVNCQMDTIENYIHFESMRIHDFKTISA